MDPEVEAVSEDGKVKQKRELGFLYHGATLPIRDGVYAYCYMREKYTSALVFVIAAIPIYIFSHALQRAKMVRWMFIHCGVMFGIV